MTYYKEKYIERCDSCGGHYEAGCQCSETAFPVQIRVIETVGTADGAKKLPKGHVIIKSPTGWGDYIEGKNGQRY